MFDIVVNYLVLGNSGLIQKPNSTRIVSYGTLVVKYRNDFS